MGNNSPQEKESILNDTLDINRMKRAIRAGLGFIGGVTLFFGLSLIFRAWSLNPIDIFTGLFGIIAVIVGLVLFGYATSEN